jgi:thymidine phosphorylase
MRDGAALAKLAEVVAAQGGDARQVEDTSKLPQAPLREMLDAPRDGVIVGINAERVGMASVHLGAGRMKKGDPIDPAVGLVLLAKVGDRLAAGDPLVEVHARDAGQVAAIRDELLAAYQWGDEAPPRGPLVIETVTR